MSDVSPKVVSVSFPAMLEFIPNLREFVADSLRGFGFSDKFSYRSEIIIDELCGNAIRFGSASSKSRVVIRVEVYDDYVSLVVKDEGGSEHNIQNLRQKVVESSEEVDEMKKSGKSLGLEIVKMLAESVEVSTDDETITKVRILRKREEVECETN